MFQKATKKRGRLRFGLAGPSGSGKTFTGLAIGTQIAARAGGRLAVIDTENESASKYADKFDFDVLAISAPYTPEKYVKAIHAAEEAGYAAILIDSITHAWSGSGGVLEIVDDAGARASGNKFAGWRVGTPIHNEFVDAMVHCKIHLIATVRSKTEYVLEDNDKGKKTPRKVGMAPIQRDGMEYEFDAFAEMNMDHALIVGKTRCSEIDGLVDKKPGKKFADTLYDWLNAGEETPAVESKAVDEAKTTQGVNPQWARVMDAMIRRGASESQAENVVCAILKKRDLKDVTEALADETVVKINAGELDRALKIEKPKDAA